MSYIIALVTGKIEYNSKCCNAPPIEGVMTRYKRYSSSKSDDGICSISGGCMSCRNRTEFNWEVEKNEQNEPLF